jgi:hypothetical protein
MEQQERLNAMMDVDLDAAAAAAVCDVSRVVVMMMDPDDAYCGDG